MVWKNRSIPLTKRNVNYSKLMPSRIWRKKFFIIYQFEAAVLKTTLEIKYYQSGSKLALTNIETW